MKVLFKKLHPAAMLPSYSKFGDAGMDMYAVEDCLLDVGETAMVETGIGIAIPHGYFGSARERSGLAAKGIRLGGGVIDSGYRGEVKGILTNVGCQRYLIHKGDRIFQVLFQAVERAEIEEVLTLPESERGADGFGSTGR